MPTIDSLRDFLANNKLALLFLPIGVGYLMSEIRIKGVGLGVASVLFCGMALGAFGKGKFALPDIVSQLGLLLFVYTVGLQSGPAFFQILRRRGLSLLMLSLSAISVGVLGTALAVKVLGLNPITSVGLFCGSLTNTPALAAAGETLKDNPNAVLLTIGYSVVYPFGVILPILLSELIASLKHLNLKDETTRAEKESGSSSEPAVGKDFRIAANLSGLAISAALGQLELRISRLRRGDTVFVPSVETVLRTGDEIHAVGTERMIREAEKILGEPIQDESLVNERSQVDFRRILLTNTKFVGKTIAETNIEADFGAVITRVRRGDIDFVPTNATILERGDRLRVVAQHAQLTRLSTYLGDSVIALRETDYLPLSLGIMLGVLIGEITIPLGGFDVKLGFSGGPLVVALFLGWRGRTGNIIWNLPMATNTTLRQLGLVLFFAGVGLKSGNFFLDAFAKEGVRLMLAGAFVTTLVSLIYLLVPLYIFKLDWVSSTGMLAGGQTQPAILSFIGKLSHSEAPNAAYVSVYPAAMILKIILAQVLIWVLM
jgi:putative transport protein